MDAASLDGRERRTIERFVRLLEQRLGAGLIGVWLYGSRARGERPHPESDVDLIVVTRRGDADRKRISRALFEAADAEGANPFRFSAQTFDPAWIDERRRIRSFYLQEVDRDKIALSGSGLRIRELGDYEAQPASPEQARELLGIADRFLRETERILDA